MDSLERWQTIAPALDEPGQRRPPPDRRKRRQAVAVACVQCRNGKSKCDGTRPQCHRCKENDMDCQYDVAEGVSRAERMKIMRRDSMSGELEELKRIFKALRSGTDNEAAAILARLRLGESQEEVAKTLPATASPVTLGQIPNLLAQESTGSQESSSKSRHGSSSLTSPIGQGPSWPTSSAVPSMSLVDGQRPMAEDAVASQTPLYRPFERDDFLLSKNEYEDISQEDGNTTDRIDPQLLHQVSSFDIRIMPSASSSRSSRSPRPSPQRQGAVHSIYPTHLNGRQPIVNTIRVHRNLDIHDLSSSIPSASGAQANEYTDGSNLQTSDLLLPTWAMLPINTWSEPGTLKHAFSGVVQQAIDLMHMGIPVSQIIETHPNIAALYDETEFGNSGILTKWAVGMVHSIYLRGNTFTCFASMYLFWSLQRWIISPSPATYYAIPEWLRPTPNQLLMPHSSIVDFIVWPAFRELVVQIPAMQERMNWLLDMSQNIQCEWNHTAGEALSKNEDTGRVDLSDEAKEKVVDLANWSVGPSFRGCVSNADSYVKIRTEGY